MVDKRILTDPSILIILATSPTGLGHLRVVDALYHGLSENASPVLLGAQDPKVSNLYRLISTHLTTRFLMEKIQSPPFDETFASIVRFYLHTHTDFLYEKLQTLLSERLTVPKVVLFVAPHPVLAHQFAAIKKRFEKEMGVRSFLIVQVTDDSPQPVWYVPGADLLFVPSQYTKNHLLSYARKQHLLENPVVVTAYPTSPLLAQDLSETEYEHRLSQVRPDSKAVLHISVPVSGAAVGTSFLTGYITTLPTLLPDTLFHTVTKDAAYTKQFIEKVEPLEYVKLSIATHDRTTVDNYEKVFKEYQPALEITKPSEQTFKALTTPKQKGGVVLLFAKPVGSQEYDNLHFLKNHGMMPHQHENEALWRLSLENKAPSDEVLKKSHHWRALALPEKPEDAAIFTAWGKRHGLFERMMDYTPSLSQENLRSNGVGQFWTKVAELVEENKEYLA